MRFTKMQGIGNDYIYIYCPEEIPAGIGAVARALSDRNYGIGGDGLILILPSEVADFRMKMFNADGSEGAMCGNGIRCVGKYVYEKGLTNKTALSIETESGVKVISLSAYTGEVYAVTVDMGEALFGDDTVLVTHKNEKEYCFTSIGMGNPHAVCFHRDISNAPVEELGKHLQTMAEYSGGVNVEFLQVESLKRAKVRIFERGSGETLACGTGACAAFAAAHRFGLLSNRVEMILPGGTLELEMRSNGHIFMTGDAVTVFEGEISLFQ